MRVFVTGASGMVGTQVVPELVGAGHEVIGLARSDASAERVAAAGAEVQRGSLDDVDSLRAGAAAADAVVHLAYVHDFVDRGMTFEDAAAVDGGAIEALGGQLADKGGPLVMTSGTLIAAGTGETITERDPAASEGPAAARGASEGIALALAERGVRPSIVRLSPSVHGHPDVHGFVPMMIEAARRTGVSAHLGSGHWPAVHVDDAARLFRLALEAGESGAIYHGVADEAVPVPEIATIIGRRLELPVEQIAHEAAEEQFGWIGAMVGVDAPASSALTRERLGWEPTRPTLVEDLEGDAYFD